MSATYAVVKFINKSTEKITVVPSRWIREVKGHVFVCWPGLVGEELTDAIKGAEFPRKGWIYHECLILIDGISNDLLGFYAIHWMRELN